MKTTWLLALGALCGAITTLSAAPAIASLGVKNSASYANPAFPNGSIAQGSLFVVFGSGMGPAQIQYSTSFPLPTTLAGTSVSATVNGSTVSCVMIYTLDGQLAAILPSATPTGTGTLTVTYNNVSSPSAPIKVVANSLGMFTRNQQGSGPGVVQDANGNYNSFVNSFAPNQTVTFWGTGLGPIAGSDASPPPTGNLPGANVTAIIGGKPATVQYAGRSAYAGVDQINLTIPAGVTGCFVSVGIFVNGVPSNFASISVSSNGPVCSDPNLFTSADIQNVANGNPMRLGTVLMSQYTATGALLGLQFKVDSETGKSYYQKYTSANFLNSLSVLADLAVSPGSCAVFQFSGGQFIDPVPYTGLDAGAAINVTAGGTAKAMANSVTGHYQSTFVAPNPLGSSNPSFLKPGSSEAIDDGSGGADVGGFKLTVTQPPVITWTNKPSAATISRSQDLAITWSGGDPSGFVYVFGQSPIDMANSTGVEFVCVGRQSDGGLTVPGPILSALPASSNISESGLTLPGGVMVVNSATITRGSAPGLDVFLAAGNTGDAKVAFAFQ
jgi:uncharacterized protein (TIGR03437 family)